MLEEEGDGLKERFDKDLDVYGRPRQVGPLVGDAKIRHAVKKTMKYALENIIGDTMPNLVKYLKANFDLGHGVYQWCYRNEETSSGTSDPSPYGFSSLVSVFLLSDSRPGRVTLSSGRARLRSIRHTHSDEAHTDCAPPPCRSRQ